MRTDHEWVLEIMDVFGFNEPAAEKIWDYLQTKAVSTLKMEVEALENEVERLTDSLAEVHQELGELDAELALATKTCEAYVDTP